MLRYLLFLLLALITLSQYGCNSGKRLAKRALPVEEQPVQEHWLGMPREDRKSWRERRQERREAKRLAKLRAAEAEAEAIAEQQQEQAAPERSEATGAERTALRPSRQAERVINTARDYLNTPYRWGGNDKHGIDCSGLMVQSFAAVGITLPRISAEQAKQGQAVQLNEVQPGDLLFFSTGSTSRITHAGLVVKVGGQDIEFIHASNSGVRIDRLSTNYWRQRYRRARRLIR